MLAAIINFFAAFNSAAAQSPSVQPEKKAVEPQLKVARLLRDGHEVSVESLKRYTKVTGFVSLAERAGGCFIYEAGWTKKPGWTWKAPFGRPAADNESAVHLTFSETQVICNFSDKRLSTDKEWVEAAYLEPRDAPPVGFVRGKRYTYPTGETPEGSHCLRGCVAYKGLAPMGSLWQGDGYVAVMTTEPGVNRLWDMGGNVW